MRLGISITSQHAGLDPRRTVQRVLDRAEAANRAGLDHLSLGDHHSVGPSGNYVQNVPMIGRIMADWPADRPIGLLLLLPLWNPVLAAEQIGTLAALSDAPFIVQTGIGWGAGQFAGMGAEPKRKGPRTDAAISVMKRLFDGETVDEPEFGLTGAAINPRPPQSVEWWIGSGLGDVPVERAAREGDAWYLSPGVSLDALPEAIDRYQQRCAAHDTKPRVILRRDLLVGDNHGETVTAGQALVSDGYRGMTDDVLIYGGVEHVTEQLAACAEVGVDDIVARTMAVDDDVAVRSVELLGAVREQLGSRSS